MVELIPISPAIHDLWGSLYLHLTRSRSYSLDARASVLTTAAFRSRWQTLHVGHEYGNRIFCLRRDSDRIDGAARQLPTELVSRVSCGFSRPARHGDFYPTSFLRPPPAGGVSSSGKTKACGCMRGAGSKSKSKKRGDDRPPMTSASLLPLLPLFRPSPVASSCHRRALPPWRESLPSSVY